ncbi:MAG: GrpB family protein [Chitinophaga sp.]|uniref:GrpB family protein n=1 Tax=Chitinophaga sp. TaxID=1869181 RepID=UPI0025C414F8|nr:GrpB family protein [Chitinophaga sp.]MBV8251291.1 GrpB family protein [Chitinophaga sp.]
MEKIEVVPYDPQWPEQFQALKEIYLQRLQALYPRIEHVGSTSVPGLPAKPILDIDIIISSAAQLPIVTSALESLGYTFRGDLGIKDRYAYGITSAYTPDTGDQTLRPKHNLYCCVDGSVSLRNHLLVRDTLRADAQLRNAYGQLKETLAAQVDNIDDYIEGKSAFIGKILLQGGIDADDVADIEDQNRKK